MASKPNPRVFLDSNVIFSALYSSKGAPAIILERFIQGDIIAVVSPQVLEEVLRVMKEKLPQALPALRRLLVSLPPEVCPEPELPEIEQWTGILSVADAAILAAAVAAKPDYFITGDRHFLSNPDVVKGSGLHIVTPSQFLTLKGHPWSPSL